MAQPLGMIPFLQWAVGAILWALANVIYLDLRRRGIRGFGRFASFWAGQPTTWISLFAVREGRLEEIEPPPDDDERLLREIRVDRELRGLGSARVGEGDAPKEEQRRTE